MAVVKGMGRDMELFHGYEVSVSKMKRVLEIDGW
jgi:hypothetical protein